MVPETLNEDLFFNLDRANLLMRRHLLDVFGGHQISPEQWEIFQFVDNQDGVSQAKLTNMTMKDKGNISRILARMIRNGWLCRVPEKPRGFVIRLTAKGREIKNYLPNLMERQVSRILEPLGKDERSELLYCLKKLRILLGDDDVVS
ncbi:MAG: MarR family winged helix-turn-helix transcriptional regulator [Oligoflexus sp.]